MTDYAKIEDHLLHMHAGLLSMRAEIPEDTKSPHAVMLRCNMTVAAEKLEEMAMRAASLRALENIYRQCPEVAER